MSKRNTPTTPPKTVVQPPQAVPVPPDLNNIKPPPGLSTRAVHDGRRRNPYQSLADPIVQTATFTFENTAELRRFMELRLWGPVEGRTEYGRYGNPTVEAVEARLAALEGADDAILFSSGMAAITTVLLALISAGDHIVITDDCYRRTRQFCLTFLKRLGVECTVVPMGDYQALESAIHPNTKIIISESPTNPYLRVLDLVQLGEIGQRHKVKTLVDATFATPLNVRPIEYGIDLVAHSATKYLAGHNDLLSGVICGERVLIANLREALGTLGAVADPHNASLLGRGLKTLGLRVERQNHNGQAVAEYLEKHPKIEQVWYPGLASHPDHQIATEQMHGYGGVVSFTVRGDLDDTSQFIDALKIPFLATSLGGVESLITQPALMSYFDLEPEQRQALGIKDNLVRLALGVEDTSDLIADLEQALRVV